MATEYKVKVGGIWVDLDNIFVPKLTGSADPVNYQIADGRDLSDLFEAITQSPPGNQKSAYATNFFAGVRDLRDIFAICYPTPSPTQTMTPTPSVSPSPTPSPSISASPTPSQSYV